MENLGFEELGKFGNNDISRNTRSLENLMCLSKWVYSGSIPLPTSIHTLYIPVQFPSTWEV